MCAVPVFSFRYRRTAIPRATAMLLQLFLPARAWGPLFPPGAPAPTMKTLAKVEPRIPITNLPFAIAAPGSHYLTTNLSLTSGNGINIQSDNVTFDLNGFSLTGAGGSGYGIYLSAYRNNICVRNGTIAGWGNEGLHVSLMM